LYTIAATWKAETFQGFVVVVVVLMHLLFPDLKPLFKHSRGAFSAEPIEHTANVAPGFFQQFILGDSIYINGRPVCLIWMDFLSDPTLGRDQGSQRSPIHTLIHPI